MRYSRFAVAAIFALFLMWPQQPAIAEPLGGLQPAHAIVIVMENKDSSEIVGNSNAPFINKLMRAYGYAANYYGVTHPSLPNYLSLIDGDFLNTWDDWDGHRYNVRTIADELEAHHLTWKAYMGGLPRPGFTGGMYPAGDDALYDAKHNPFVLMNSIRKSPVRARNIVSDQQLFLDLQQKRLPRFSFISPDMCNDMHGIVSANSPCPDNQAQLVAAGDLYLARVIPAIMRSPEWTGNSVIFLVWDEADNAINGCCLSPKGDGGGRVVAVVISREGARHYRSATSYNHYSVLKTLLQAWGLGCLANTCKSQVKPMTEFLRPHR